MDIQRAGFVIGIELGVFSGLDFRINHAFANKKLGPLKIGVSIE